MSLKKEADKFIAMPVVHFNSELRILIDRIAELEATIESSLKISSLWLPGEIVGEEFAGEAQALHSMRDTFLDMVSDKPFKKTTYL